MNLWLIGGGIYIALVLFALALGRMASSSSQLDSAASATTEYEELFDSEAAVQRATSDAPSRRRQGPQPRRSGDLRTHRSSQLRPTAPSRSASRT